MLGLAFDTETTGLPFTHLPLDHPEQPRVVQLGCILFDETGDEKEVLDTLFYPDGWEIDEDEDNVHGWTMDDCLFLGQPAADVISAFNQMASRAEVIVAHHIEFDMRMLSIEAAHANSPLVLPSNKFCTMKKSAPAVGIPYKGGGFKFPSLEEAIWGVLGKTVEDEDLHEAMFDARLAKELFLELTKRNNS